MIVRSDESTQSLPTVLAQGHGSLRSGKLHRRQVWKEVLHVNFWARRLRLESRTIIEEVEFITRLQNNCPDVAEKKLGNANATAYGPKFSNYREQNSNFR
jgi:hypothetical protein